jgi:hypothetical protein
MTTAMIASSFRVCGYAPQWISRLKCDSDMTSLAPYPGDVMAYSFGPFALPRHA